MMALVKGKSSSSSSLLMELVRVDRESVLSIGFIIFGPPLRFWWGGALLNNVGDISIAYLFLGLRTCLGLENFALVRELCPGL